MTEITPLFDPMTGQPIPGAVPPAEPVFTASVPPAPIPIPLRMTRAQVQEIRRREREEGVNFALTRTGITAKVRDLPFSDRTMLMGIPVELRSAVNSAIAVAQSGEMDNVSDAIGALETLDNLAKAVCCAGFIWPRLVLHEWQLDGSDDCWLVDEIHSDERAAYRDMVTGDREQGRQEVERLSTFPGAGVEESSVR